MSTVLVSKQIHMYIAYTAGPDGDFPAIEIFDLHNNTQTHFILLFITTYKSIKITSTATSTPIVTQTAIMTIELLLSSFEAIG